MHNSLIGKVSGPISDCGCITPAELYEFTRALETYNSVVVSNTTLVLSTDSDLMGLIKRMEVERR